MSDEGAPDSNVVPHRTPWRAAPIAVALLAVAAVLAAAAWWQVQAAQPPGPAPAPSPTTAAPDPGPAPAPDTQQTLLVQVRDDRGLAVCDILMGVGGPDEGAGADAVFVSVPPGLLVNAGAAGEMTLARTALLSDTLASQNALALQVGVRVDGALTMERLAFAGLVDAVNGVLVDGPVGKTQLTGTEAADYVITRGPAESEAERMARCQSVWRSILIQLPADPDRLRQVIISLGVLARVTTPVETVVSILGQARVQIVLGYSAQAVLPTAVVRPGSDQTDVAVQPATSVLMGDMFPEAVLRPGDSEPPRIYVISASADPFAVVEVRERLVGSGFGVVVGGPLGTSTVTRVTVPDPALLEVGGRVAAAIGLAPETVRVGIMQDESADAQVVVGADPVP